MGNPFKTTTADIEAAIAQMRAQPQTEATVKGIEVWEQLLDQKRKGDAYKEKIRAEANTLAGYREALMLCSSEDRAGVLIGFADRLTDDEVRTLLSENWSVTEAWSGDEELRDGMYGLLSRVAPLILEEGRPFKPTGDTITVYRGNGGETPGAYASSWTLNRKVAERFATMATSMRGMVLGMYREGAVPTVWRARADVSDVLGYFDDRGEREVVLSGAHLRNVEKIAEARR